MSNSNHYIIIDDSQIDIFIASRMLLSVYPSCRISSFVSAGEALNSIRAAGMAKEPTVLLVDINMPVMDGFQFMEEFEKLPEEVKSSYVTCFLTSSINESDIAVAKTIPSIKMYINKPLSQNTIHKIFSTIA